MVDYENTVKKLLEASDMALETYSGKEMEYAQLALDLSKRHQYDVGIFESHLTMGIHLMFASRNEEAVEHFEICYAFARSMNDTLRIARAANLLGITYYNLGITSRGLECLLEALNIAARNGYIDIECEANNNICGILDELQDYSTTIKYLFDILEKSSAAAGHQHFTSDTPSDRSRPSAVGREPVFPRCVVLRNIAHTYHKMGNLPEAERYVNMATDAAERANNLQILCETLYIHGMIHRDKRELENAHECFTNALSLAERLKSGLYLVRIRINLSLLFAEKKMYNNAFRLAKEAYTLAIGLDCPILTKEAASTMADICQLTCNKDMLIEALTTYKTVSSLLEQENKRKQQAYAKAQLMLHNLKKDNERLRVEVERDPLTGCLSSRTFPDRISHAISTYSKTGALIFLDIDNLKMVNDSHGHDVGDELLKSFAQDLMNTMPKESIKIRISGDEFLVFMPNAGKDEAVNALDKLLKTLSRQRRVGSVMMPVLCSAGIALYPEHSSDIFCLRRMADAAMYTAKQAGRGRYRIYTAS